MLSATPEPIAAKPNHAQRVVYIVNFLAPDLVAICRRWSTLVAKLNVLVSVPMEGNRKWDPVHDGVDVTVQRTWTITKTDRHPSGYQDVNYVHLPLDTYRQLRRLNPQVIVSAEMGARSMLASIYRHRHRGVKHVVAVSTSEHIEKSRDRWFRRKQRNWLLNRADAVTYHGESCRRFLLDLGVPAEKLFLWIYAADPTKPYRGELVSQDQSPERIRLLTVGQLIERKGVHIACQQLARWANENSDRELTWTLGGSGPLEQTIRSEALPPNMSIEMLGNCTADQIRELYRKHELMLFPTLGDEWGLVTDEAMISGLAVIGSNLAQSCETLLQTGVNGFVYDPDDYHSLGSAFSEWASMTSSERMAMRVAARNSVCDRTPEASASQIADLCQWLSQ